MTHPVSIEGKIKLSDGSETHFSINPDLGWQQWFNSHDNLGLTVDLLDDLVAATAEHIRDEDEDEAQPESHWDHRAKDED